MKKIICLLICTLIMMTSMCIVSSAANASIYTYEVDGVEYTVEITDTNINDEKKQAIADSMVGADESEIMTANVWCDLFGHDYKYTTVSVIQHKAYANAPRCRKETFDVTYCEDCDYTEQTLVNVTYINCCAEE